MATPALFGLRRAGHAGSHHHNGSIVITMALSFVVFTFGSLLVAIQVASGQLTPRIIATTYESCNRRVSVVPIGGEDYRRQDSRKSGKGVQSGRRGGNGRCPQPQAQAASIRCFR